MTWRTRPDGSIDLAVLTGYALAVSDGDLAVQLFIARTPEQLTGDRQPDVEQLVLPPKVATDFALALLEQLAPGDDAVH